MNSKKPYEKNKTKDRSKMTATMYEKAFNSFAEMVETLKNLHPEFKNIFIYDDEEVLPINSAVDVFNYFAQNMPNVTDKKNIPVSLSISANKVALKTSKFFSVEWNFKYDKDGKTSDLVATITTFTRERNYEELDEMIAKLTDSWTVKVSDKKKFVNREAKPIAKEAVVEAE